MLDCAVIIKANDRLACRPKDERGVMGAESPAMIVCAKLYVLLCGMRVTFTFGNVCAAPRMTLFYRVRVMLESRLIPIYDLRDHERANTDV